jgi:hypothetical protein
MAARICDLVLVLRNRAPLKVWGIGVLNGFTLGFPDQKLKLDNFLLYIFYACVTFIVMVDAFSC